MEDFMSILTAYAKRILYNIFSVIIIGLVLLALCCDWANVFYPLQEVFMLVATYGSLKKGFHNHGLMQGSEYRGIDSLSGFAMYKCSIFPMAVASDDTNDTIMVEVYEVSKETLCQLDYLEGHPEFYRRVHVDTIYGDAFIYIGSRNQIRDNMKKIENGVWKQSDVNHIYSNVKWQR